MKTTIDQIERALKATIVIEMESEIEIEEFCYFIRQIRIKVDPDHEISKHHHPERCAMIKQLENVFKEKTGWEFKNRL